MFAARTTAFRIALALAAAASGGRSSETVRTFEGEAVGRPPSGFIFQVARESAPAQWIVQRQGTNNFVAHVGSAAARRAFALAILQATRTPTSTISRSAATTMRVLVAEDELDLARTLAKALTEEGYAVDIAGAGDEALVKAAAVSYDAILLDLMLPGLDGLSALSALRRDGVRTPVLILTARDGVDDKVRGLNVGADDYLTKPFALSELLARIRALIRRASPDPITELAAGPFMIDTSTRTVRKDRECVDLTAREYAILELLVRRKGSVVTRSAIYEHVYDEHEDTLSNVLDVFIAALRRKLGPDVIRTRRGHGYLIDG